MTFRWQPASATIDAMERLYGIVALICGIVAAVGGAAPVGELVACRVVSVHDGDTLRAIDGSNRELRVRLHGIDAPELGQPFGRKARDYLTDLVKGREVTLRVEGRDKYGRTLAAVVLEGREINRELVAAGMAWHYARFSDDPQLAGAQRAA